MQPRLSLEHRVVMLARAGDLDLVDGARVFSPSEKPAARCLGELLRDFDYMASVEFEAACAGKSAAYRNVLARKLSGAEAKAQKRSEFYDAVQDFRRSDRVLALLPEAAQATLLALRHELEQVAGRAS
ncbi:MAG: hypothetical protein ACO1PM_13695 [Acidovorax sp.]